MKEACKQHPAVAVAGTLDQIGITTVGLIDSVHHSLSSEMIEKLAPGYHKAERRLEDLAGSIKFETENVDVHDAMWRFYDLRSVLVWKLSGPVFLRAAGLSDEEIARVCNMLGIGAAGDEERRLITEG